MNTLVVIEEDNKIRRDIKLFLSEFKDDIEADYFNTIQSFEAKYLLSKEEQETLGASVESERKGYLKSIGVICISLDMISGDLIAWIKKIRKLIKNNLLRPEEADTRFVFLAHAEGEVKLDFYCIEPIEDIIYKPLDKQFFQQKLEIILNLPSNTSPSFLISQKSKDTVEMGKQSKVEEISDFGICIRNPRLLSDGQFASFYSRLFEETSFSSVMGKSYKSFESVKEKGSFYCYFNFFGVEKEQLNSVRRRIYENKAKELSPYADRIHSKLEKLSEEKIAKLTLGDPRKKMPPGSLTIVDDADILAEEKYFVVIDMAKEVQDTISSLVGENFPKAKTVVFPTLAHFMEEFFEDSMEIEESSFEETEEQEIENEEEKIRGAAFPQDSILLSIDKESSKLISISPKLKEGETFLGYSDTDLKQDTELWKKAVHPMDRSFKEFYKYVSTGQNGTLDIWFCDKNKFDFLLQIKGSTTVDRVSLELTDVTESKGQNGPGGKSKANENLPKLDAIFIDTSMVQQPYSKWAKNFKNNLKAAKLIEKKKNVKIYLLGMEGKGKQPKDLAAPGFDGFFYKPLERSFVLQSLMIHSYPGVQQVGDNRLNYYVNSQPIILTTTVKMMEISEYGIAIKYPAFIRPGVFIRFVNDILKIEDGTPIIGRCYYSESEPDEEGLYVCYFLYFGVTDEVFKKIRLWIREKYIEGKTGGSAP